MFIKILYTDTPELSAAKKPTEDTSVERVLLVNPQCPIRIMLEYIRDKCKLGIYTNFDLCIENGALMGLFNLPNYVYATEQFQHKRTYYVIVVKQEKDKLLIFPQLNNKNTLYTVLQNRVRRFITTGEVTLSTSSGTTTSVRTTASRMLKKKKKI